MFSETTRAKLGKLIPRLASDQQGEVVATVAAIRRVLKTEGADLHDLAKAATGQGTSKTETRSGGEERHWSVSEWHKKAIFCREHIDIFRSRESEFIEDMVDNTLRYPEPTPKQAAWLNALYERARRYAEAS